MGEVVENLIVKVCRQLPADQKIPGDIIKEWNSFTLKYFKESPNAFMVENEFYNVLTSNMKVKIVKKNLMLPF